MTKSRQEHRPDQRLVIVRDSDPGPSIGAAHDDHDDNDDDESMC